LNDDLCSFNGHPYRYIRRPSDSGKPARCVRPPAFFSASPLRSVVHHSDDADRRAVAVSAASCCTAATAAKFDQSSITHSLGFKLHPEALNLHGSYPAFSLRLKLTQCSESCLCRYLLLYLYSSGRSREKCNNTMQQHEELRT